MGQLSKWFANIRQRSDRQAISKVYGLDEKIMTSFCEHLSLVRNHAAHHARLWNRNFTKTPTLPKKGDSRLVNSLNVSRDNPRALRKLYNTFVTLTWLMETICGETHWKNRLMTLIEKHIISTQHMGFPEDWSNRPIWQ